MLNIEIQTPDNLADAPHAGTELAKVLRSIARKLEEDVSITPTSRNDEWQTETYRHAERVTFIDADNDPRDVLIGAVYELRSEAPETPRPSITIDTRRLRDALNAMPYGGTAWHGMRPVETADDLIARLDVLARLLKRTAKQAEDNEAELVQLRNDRAALRRLIGTQA